MGWFSKSDDGFFLSTVLPTGEGARIEKMLGIVNGEAITVDGGATARCYPYPT